SINNLQLCMVYFYCSVDNLIKVTSDIEFLFNLRDNKIYRSIPQLRILNRLAILFLATQHLSFRLLVNHRLSGDP
ncbi:hypothetical protein L9F63_007319, partial [Diploptera punctata]